MILAIILLASILAAIQLPIIKEYIRTRNIMWILLSILCYAILTYVYVYLLESNKISTLYPLMKIVSIITVILAGVYIFQEKLSYVEIVGITLACIAISMLTYDHLFIKVHT